MDETADEAAQIDLDPSLMLERLDTWVDGLVRLIPNLIVALLVVALIWVIARWIGALIRRSATARRRSNLGEVVGSFARWAVVLLGVLVALTIVMPSLKPGDLIAGLGVSSVAIGFAFKDILQNWLAGILILVRQPFEIGDQVAVTDYEGTVERIESRATLLITYDNQRIVIPNSDIYTGAVTVRTAFEQRRSEYDIGIGYGDDIGRACGIITKTIAGLKGVAAKPEPEALPWSLDASWVTIRARWWSKPDRASLVQTRARVIAGVKQALTAAGVDLPFDTQVLLLRDQTDEREDAPADDPNQDAAGRAETARRR